MSRLKGSGGGGGGGNKDNLFADDVVELVLAVSEGEIKGLKDDSTKNLYINGTPHKAPDGTNNFEKADFELHYDVGVAEPRPIAFKLEGTGTTHVVGQSLAKDTPKTEYLPNGAGTLFNILQVRIGIDQLVKYKDDGAYRYEVEFDLEWQKQSEGIWHPFTSDKRQTIKGKTTSGTAREYSVVVSEEAIALDGTDTYIVRVTKRSDDSTDKKKTDISFQTVEMVLSKDISDPEIHPHLAYVKFFGKIGEQIAGAPHITAVWQGLLCSVPSNYDAETRAYDETTAWDGTFKVKKAFTNNPFWLIRELALNPRFGLAASLKYMSVNDYELYALAKHADEMVPSGVDEGVQPRFTFNGVLDKQMDGLELLNYVAGSAFARVFDDLHGQLRIVADRNDTSIMLVTPESVVETNGNTFSYTKTDVRKRANSLTGNYVDPDMDWQTQQVQLKDDEAIQRFGLIQATQQLVGCTDRQEAYRKLKYYLTTGLTEVLSVSFTMPMSGILLEPYQVVDIADPDMGWSLSGRALTFDGRLLSFRDPLTFDVAGTYTLKLQTSEGMVERTIYIPTPDIYVNVSLDSPVTEAVPSYPAFTIESAEALGISKPFRILRVDEVNGREDVYAVTAIELNRNKFWESDNALITDGAIPAPEYSYKAPVVVKEVQSVTVEESRNGRDDRFDLLVSWIDPNPGGLNPRYEVQLIKNDQVIRSLVTSDTSIQVDSVPDSEFSVYVTVRNSFGQAVSAEYEFEPAYETHETLNLQWDTLGEGSISGGFQSTGHLSFEVELLLEDPQRPGVKLNLLNEPTVKQAVARILSVEGTLLRTLTSTDGEFRYPLADNIEDHGGNPSSDLNIEVTLETIEFTETDVLLGKAFRADGIPQIVGVDLTPRPNGFLGTVVFDETFDEAFEVEWAVATEDLVGFEDENLVGTGPSINISSLLPDTQYFVWLRFKNGFNQIYPSVAEGLTFTTEKLRPEDVGADPEGSADDAEQAAKDYADSKFVVATQYDIDMESIQSQLDGSTTSWFADGVPTLSNEPAVNWTDNATKDLHLGDSYTDDLTGVSYRFKYVDGVYAWHTITDTLATQALAEARAAQDTADGKRRVFVVTPVPPYDVGDLWDTGSGVKRATVAKALHAGYAGTDWTTIADTTDYNAIHDDAQERADGSRTDNLDLYNGGILDSGLSHYLAVKCNSGSTSKVYKIAEWVSNSSYDGLVIKGKLSYGSSDRFETGSYDFSIRVTTGASFSSISKATIETQGENSTGYLKVHYELSGTELKVTLYAELTSTYRGLYLNAEWFYNAGVLTLWQKGLFLGNTYTLPGTRIQQVINRGVSDGADVTDYVSIDNAAQAKANLAQELAEAHADGIVTAEEERAIADAQAKADAAEAAAIEATKNLTFQLNGGAGALEIVGNNVFRNGNSMSSWTGSVHSLSGLVGAARLSFLVHKPSGTNGRFMMGLTTDPQSNAHYNTIDFAMYIDSTRYYLYLNGTASGTVLNTTPKDGDHVEVIYDGVDIIMRVNSTVVYRSARILTNPLFIDSSFSGDLNGGAKQIEFTPYTNLGDAADNANLADKTGGKVGGWNIVDDKIYSGGNTTLNAEGFKQDAGIILDAVGNIISKNIQILADGTVKARADISGSTGTFQGLLAMQGMRVVSEGNKASPFDIHLFEQKRDGDDNQQLTLTFEKLYGPSATVSGEVDKFHPLRFGFCRQDIIVRALAVCRSDTKGPLTYTLSASYNGGSFTSVATYTITPMVGHNTGTIPIIFRYTTKDTHNSAPWTSVQFKLNINSSGSDDDPGYVSGEILTKNYHQSGYTAGSKSSEDTDSDTVHYPVIPPGGSIP